MLLIVHFSTNIRMMKWVAHFDKYEDDELSINDQIFYISPNIGADDNNNFQCAL